MEMAYDMVSWMESISKDVERESSRKFFEITRRIIGGND
jgi:hypothetical protein